MATTKKPAAGNGVTETTRREKIVGWAELGIESAASAQKQWNDITFAYTDLALKAWKDSMTLNFPLLSDFNKTVIRQYGVVNPDMIGLKDIAKRAVFVLDQQGVVRHREVLDDARNEPDYDKVRAALASV